MFNKFAQQNIAKAGSASFGLCETFAYLDGSMLADDQVFLEAAAQGQTVFASTGDSGSACPVVGANGVPLSGVPGMVMYPASSPYVVGVGGTTLTTASGYDYIAEIGWDAGGGGVSVWEYSPYWQQPVLPHSRSGSRSRRSARGSGPDRSACSPPCGAAAGSRASCRPRRSRRDRSDRARRRSCSS